MRCLVAIAVLLFLLTPSAKADTSALTNFLWVPCFNSNNVYKVDITTHEVAAIIPVGEGPAGVAVAMYSVYVTCRYSSRLYVISKSEDYVTDSLELSPEIAFGIGVAVDPADRIYVVGRFSYYAYEMSMARLLKLDIDGTLLACLDLVQVQGDNWSPDYNQMSVIGIAIREPEIMLPWQRSWDVNTGIIITDTSLADFQDFSLNPRVYGYRGPGAAYDQEDRGWSSGDREALNYLIGHRLPDYWGYYRLGPWGGSGQIYGDVAVDNLGFVWTGSALGILMRFDPVSHQTTSFQLGSQIKGIAIDRFGFIWVAFTPLNVLKKFDSDGNIVGDPVWVGAAPMGFGDMTGFEYGRRMTPVVNESDLPNSPILLTAYPNPFNAATQIRYSLGETGLVNICIYNLVGQKLETLFDGVQQAGSHEIIWDAKNLPSGVYLARMESGSYFDNLKLSFIK